MVLILLNVIHLNNFNYSTTPAENNSQLNTPIPLSPLTKNVKSITNL